MSSINKIILKDGITPRWIVRYDVTENGKRIQKKKRCKTAKEAKIFSAEIEHRINNGLYSDSRGLTVEQFLNQWIETYVSGNIRPNTETNYRSNVDHICKYIGNVPLDKLATINIQKAYNDILKEEYKPAIYKEINGLKTLVSPARTYSPKSLKNLNAVLHLALERARKEGLIVRNPSDDVVLPSVPEKQHTIPTPEQLSILMNEINNCECAPVIRMCMFLGCRRGEALGLYWKDVDFNSSIISFNRAYIRNTAKDYKAEIGELKTKNGKRSVYMPEPLREELQMIKEKREESIKEAGSFTIDSPFVFLSAAGKPFEPDSVSRAFKRACIRAGLPEMHLHDLRHTAITYMLEAGVNPRTVSEISGHSSPAFTMQQYGHVLQNARKEASDALMKSLFNK